MLFKTIRNCQVNISASNPVMLWHERLGHVNFQTLKKMIDSKQLPGITIGSVDGLFCEACQHGKLARLPFKKVVKERISKPGEVIHMDVCGKMTHSSIGGAYYFVLFKDDCTSYKVVYFLKHKSDVFSKFLQFVKMVRGKLEIKYAESEVIEDSNSTTSNFSNISIRKELFKSLVHLIPLSKMEG